MKVSSTACVLVFAALLAGCGLNVAASARLKDMGQTASTLDGGAAVPVSQNAAPAPAEMYPSL